MLKPSLIQGPLHSEESLECSNGIFKSEGSGGFLHPQKDIPNLYPKLLHPVLTKWNQTICTGIIKYNY